MQKKIGIIMILFVISLGLTPAQAFSNDSSAEESSGNSSYGILQLMAPVLVRTVIPPAQPELVLTTGQNTDKLSIAWTPGSDGITPQQQTVYEIHLFPLEPSEISRDIDFEPTESTLKKTVRRWTETEIEGLEAGREYSCKVIARYPNTDNVSPASKAVFVLIPKDPVVVHPDVTVAMAADLGLGKHTVGTDGTTYTYSGGTAPNPGNVLFSEDVDGGITLRTVETATVNSDGTIFVETSDAALSDVLQEAEVNSSFNLIDVAGTVKEPHSTTLSARKSSVQINGSRTSKINWKNNLLSIEQTDFSYQEEDYSFTPMGEEMYRLKMSPTERNATATQSFTVDLKAGFQPRLNTSINIGTSWSWGIPKPKLKSAKFSASGTLYMEALAKYDFNAAASVEKEVTFFKKTYTSMFAVGPVPVYQEVILSLEGTFEASAEAEINAEARATLEQEITVGIKFDGSNWSPFVENNNETGASLTLNIAGKASAEIRLIPKVEVKYYKVVGGFLTAEPFIQSNFGMETVTSNPFIQADLLSQGISPLNLSELHAFIGMECNVGLTLPSIIRAIGGDAFNTRCVLGTETGCWMKFDRAYLFDIPILSLERTSAGTVVQLKAVDGLLTPLTPNQFDPSSVHWYVVPDGSIIPDDATITPGGCSRSGSTTTCTATFTPGSNPVEDYTIFASGHGGLGEIARQFKEIKITPPGPATEIHVTNGGSWGSWTPTYMCPNFTYVEGIALKVESGQGGGDDTALNNVRLYCSDGSTVESNDAHTWGTWGSSVECTSGRYMTGYKLKIEGDQGSGDDTAANSMEGICTDGATIVPTNGGAWGSWGNAVSCPAGKRVCGAALKIEANQGSDGDDTGVNDVALFCCE
ncbi:MAG: hypothetical protein D3924_07990 [Candidatus Electrothrix sp. AR4]|nr:hypothetical protein [Candidatus Electrothrix sp. AR4]